MPTFGMTNSELSAAANEVLAVLDPSGTSFWRIELSPAENPYLTVTYKNPAISAAGTTPGTSGLFRRSWEAIGVTSEPWRRLYHATYGLEKILRSNSIPPSTDGEAEEAARRVALSTLYGGVMFLRTSSSELTTHDPAIFGFKFKITGSLRISFRFIFDQPALPIFIPLPPRKPRKWGRSLTPRWEEEHKKLVAHRKFSRNTKRMENNPTGNGFGRKGTGNPMMSTWQDRRAAIAKRTALEKALAAVQQHYKRSGKKIDRKDATQVVALLKKRVQLAKKKARAWQPKIRSKRKK